MIVLMCSILVFACIMFGVIALTEPTHDKSLLNSRIDTIARNMADDFNGMPSLTEHEMNAGFMERIIRPALRKISSFASRMTPASATDEIRALLIKAGNPGRIGVAEFIGIKVVSLFALFAIGLVLQRTVGGDLPTRLIIITLCLIVGFVMPDALVQQVITARHALVRKRLPDTIDLLIVSVEAGLGFDGAVAKVVEKVRGPIAEEFGRVLDEMRLGKQRSKAMKDMALRMDIPEITTFVAAIYQSEQLGVSIANVLRVQSESVRIARTQAIRIAAAKLPVMMLIPLVFFIFPAILVVLVGPGLVSIHNAFK
jgi:tight adherence protein C